MTAEEAKDVLRNTAWMSTDDGTKVFAAIKIASEALEKAEKYGWHDLRKDHDDLPEGMELKDTERLMAAGDYRSRFVAEYFQTKIKYEKLKAYNTKIEAANMSRFDCDTVSKLTSPPHDCPAELLRQQQTVMGEYLHILELRAVFEEIDLKDIEETFSGETV